MNKISEQFLKELKELLKKYNAELELEENTRSYYIDYSMKVWAYAQYDNNGNVTSDTIDLGHYLNGK